MKINFYNSKRELKYEIEEISSIIEKIRDGFWADEVTSIREHLKNNNKQDASLIKSNLPAFTHSATFKDKRRKESIDEYNGLIGLDYDYVDDVESLKSIVMSIPYTYLAFVSPSGNGLKVFVKTDATKEQHKSAFKMIRMHYDEVCKTKSDSSVQDVSRLCFVSYDPELYHNESSEVLEITTNVSPEWVWNFTSNLLQFIEGQRNNFIYRYGCNANRYDIEMSDALQYATMYSQGDFSNDEIIRTIESAYENNTHERGLSAGVAKPAKSPKLEVDDPFIPDWIYDELPDTLRRACHVFEGRERDVFFTSALAVISGGLYNVEGLYANERVYPNLFTFIIAPPASGKGSMTYGRQLGECFHNALIDESRDALNKYKKEKRIFEMRLRKAKIDDVNNLQEPEEPLNKVFFLPANTSSSMLIKHLNDNGGIGCFCETEADTLSTTLNQEWGNFSDILRKGFHGETITKSRKTDLEYLEIPEPKFSVCITGTPGQRKSLITSIEDGLYSRFMIYRYNATPKWRKTFTKSLSQSKKDIFSNFSRELCDLFKSDGTRQFTLSEKQGERLDRHFEENMHHNVALYNSNVTGVTFRLALMCYKIAMVISALRSNQAQFECEDRDFDIAMYLVNEVYMPHSIKLFNEITPKGESFTEVEKDLIEWIDKKVSFNRNQVRQVGTVLGIPERTMTSLLTRLIDKGLIKRVKNGEYSKR